MISHCTLQSVPYIRHIAAIYVLISAFLLVKRSAFLHGLLQCHACGSSSSTVGENIQGYIKYILSLYDHSNLSSSLQWSECLCTLEFIY